MKVVLFDIDGTLQSSPGIGRLAYQRTLRKILGDESAAASVVLSGRVDWAVWRELLAAHGYSADEVDAQLHDFMRLFVAELAAVLELPDTPKPSLLPGTRPLLDVLVRDESVLLGLVTGNVEAGAWLKLGCTNIDRYFYFGAFGNDSWDRNALPTIALERAARFANGRTFSGADTIIIGDTVHDIACARAVGARVIAVATGTDTVETLAAAGADAILPTLEHTETVLELIQQ